MIYCARLLLSIRVYLNDTACVHVPSRHRLSAVSRVCQASAHLPHAHHGVRDEDEENDEGLDEGGDGFLTFLKHGQHLRGRERWEGSSFVTL